MRPVFKVIHDRTGGHSVAGLNSSLKEEMNTLESTHFRCLSTVKPVLSGHSKKKIGFQYQLLLNAGQKYCRMLQESILQYFCPSLSYRLSLRPLFCLFLSGCLRQVVLYV